MAEKSTKDLEPSTSIALLRIMLLIRIFEEKIVDVYSEQDMKTPVHLCIGQEAIAAGVCSVLNKTDYVFTNHRSHGHCIAKGADISRLYAEFYGRVDGYCKGKGGSMHLAIPEIGICGTSSIVGGGIPIAVGAALASAMKADERIAVAFFGDGAVDEGTFHESLNFAGLKKLPVIFVCENNHYAVNSPAAARHAHANIASKAIKYNVFGIQVDGNDVTAVRDEAAAAAAKCRNGEGPTLIECITYRWKGHVGPECDVEKGCRLREELDMWTAKCPIERLKQQLKKNGVLTENTYSHFRSEIIKEVDQALEWARNRPFPDKNDLFAHVYCKGS